MKQIQKLLTILVFLLMSIPAFSQWSFGVNVAYENTGVNWKYNDIKKSISNVSGFSVGPIVAYEAVENYLDIQSGINFAMNGFSTQDQSIFGQNHHLSESEITRLYYLQLPIYAVGKLPVREVELLLEVGPILAAGVGSKTTTNYMIGVVKYTEEHNDIFEDTLHPFNCMIHFGIGAEYMGARITAGYNLGIFDIVRQDPNRNDAYSDGFFVSIGYMFDFD